MDQKKVKVAVPKAAAPSGFAGKLQELRSSSSYAGDVRQGHKHCIKSSTRRLYDPITLICLLHEQ
jgi:hypothetical protein